MTTPNLIRIKCPQEYRCELSETSGQQVTMSEIPTNLQIAPPRTPSMHSARPPPSRGHAIDKFLDKSHLALDLKSLHSGNSGVRVTPSMAQHRASDRRPTTQGSNKPRSSIHSSQRGHHTPAKAAQEAMKPSETAGQERRPRTSGEVTQKADPFQVFFRPAIDKSGAVTQDLLGRIQVKFQKAVSQDKFAIQKAFAFFDRDGSGSIGFDEFKKTLLDNNVWVTDREVAALIKRYDTNNDGRISYYEFLDAVAPYAVAAPPSKEKMREYEVKKEEARLEKNVRWAIHVARDKIQQRVRGDAFEVRNQFRVLDKDGIGAISVKDFRMALKNFNLGLSERELDTLVKKFDYDGDGFITYHEFIKFILPSDHDAKAIVGEDGVPLVPPTPELHKAARNRTLIKMRGLLEKKGKVAQSLSLGKVLTSKTSVLGRIKGRANDIAKAFEFFDRDGNGKVDEGEFKHVLDMFSIHLDHRDFQLLMKYFDTDGDNMISYSEFMEGLSNKKLESLQDGITQEKLEQLENADKEEVQAMINGQPVPPQVKKTLDILQEKFTTQFQEVGPQSLLKAFRHYDKNSDGVITADEFSRIMLDNNIPITRSQMQRVMRVFDKNKDGHIDYREFVRGLLPPQADFEHAKVPTDGPPSTAHSHISNIPDTKALQYVDESFKCFHVRPPKLYEATVPEEALRDELDPEILMMPAKRRMLQEMQIKETVAHRLLRKDRNDQARLYTLMQKRYPNGVLGVDSPAMEGTQVYAEQREKMYKDSVKWYNKFVARQENLVKRNNAGVGYDFLHWPETREGQAQYNAALDKNKPGERQQYSGTFGHPGGRLFDSTERNYKVMQGKKQCEKNSWDSFRFETNISENPLNFRRMVNLRNHNSNGRGYNIVTGHLTEHCPPTQAPKVNSRLEHPSMNIGTASTSGYLAPQHHDCHKNTNPRDYY